MNKKLTPKQMIWSVRAHEPSKRKEVFTCPNCFQSFKPKKLYQLYCSVACENRMDATFEKFQEEKLNAICQDCGINFRKTDMRALHGSCDICRRSSKRTISKNRNPPVPWEKKKKRGRPLPHHVLDAIAEKKRVMEDSGWSHYIKGRKWDRI